MQFLNGPILALLLPLLGLPLLIHVLNRKFPQTIHFSSIEHIKKAIAERSRLFRWRHVLMTIVRTIAVLLLLFVFLKPILPRFGSNPLSSEQRHVLILFDHSLSMEHESNLLTARKRGLLEAQKIIDTLEPDDLLNVVLVARRPSTCFFDFSANHEEAVKFLEQLEPGAEAADFNKANASAGQILDKIDGVSEVYYISDLQRRNWGNVSFESIPPRTRLFFVDVGLPRRSNRGILQATIDQPVVLAGEAFELGITLGNFSETAFDDEIEVILDGGPGLKFPAATAPWSEKQVRVPLTAPGPGLHTLAVHLKKDDLPLDDRRCLTFHVLDKEEVVFVTDKDDLATDGARFLKVAMNPYRDLAGSLLPRQLRSSELSPANLATTTKVIMTGIDTLLPPAADSLIRFLAAGGGAIYFLDGSDDSTNLLTIDDAMGEGSIPLRLFGRQRVEDSAHASPHRFGSGNFRSPFLGLFRGSNRQSLALLEFYDIYQAAADDKESVLLYYADGTPAMARAYVGLGTLLLCNFSVSELSSNLARQQVFPAWVQELLKNIASAETLEQAYQAGDEIAAEVWQEQLKDTEMLDPDKHPVTMSLELTGNRYYLSFQGGKPGFYTLGTGPSGLAFAVNCSAEESDLRRIDEDMLPRRVSRDHPERAAGAHFVSGGGDYATLKSGQPLFHYFLLGTLGLLILEIVLQKIYRLLSS